MTPEPALIEAVNDLTNAASHLAQRWAADNAQADADLLFHAIRDFSQAFHAQVAAELRSLGEAIAGAGHPADISSIDTGTPTPVRFATALKIVDLGVFDPVIIAQAIISACGELAPEDDLPAFDPAVRLMASQLTWVCEAAPSLKESDQLIFECVSRSLDL